MISASSAPLDPATMLGLESRASDSPYVARVWRSAALGGVMTSVAATHREIVFWWSDGALHAAVRGPETAPTVLDVPPGHTSFGIVLTHGTVLPHLPAAGLVDDAAVCRHVTARGIVMGGEELPVPTFDTAEGFVERLVRTGLVRRDALVDGVLADGIRADGIRAGGSTTLSRRSIERRVRAATGLTPGTVARIERARWAAVLLGAGRSPLEVVGLVGYHDHPHLARSVARYIGASPSRLRAPDTALSLLHEADELPAP